jgi:predicted MFS family arabinose efflux permease
VRTFLESRPIPTAVIFTVVGVLPLYLTSAQAVRLQQELGFGKTKFGIMVACFYLVSSVASLALGPRIDRKGPTGAFRLAALLSLTSAALIAVAATRWEAFALFLGIAGLANAYGQLASNLAVTGAVRGGRQGVAFGAKQAAVPTGAMLAGLAVPWVSGTLSWRWVYVGAAAVALIITMISPHYDHTPPPQTPRTRAALTPPLVALMIGAALAGGTGNAFASFIVDAAVTAGLAETAAARLLTVASMVAIVSRLTCGAIIDRRRSSGILEATCLLTLAMAGLLTLATSGTSVTLFLLGTMLVFAGAWGWPGVMQYLTIRTVDMPAATSTGATLAGGFFGTVVIPPLVGAAAENLSYSAAFLGLTVVVATALAAIHLSRRLARVSQPT